MLRSNNCLAAKNESRKALVIGIAVTLLLFAAPGVLAQKKPNFSGHWELNKTKSSSTRMENRVMVIEHRDPQIKVNLTEKYPNGEQVWNPLQLTTDGKKGFYTQVDGKSEQNFQVAWEGAKLVIKWNQDREPTGRKTETWTLSPNGKTLTITLTRLTPEGKAPHPDQAGKPVTQTIVMNKK
jgi:hypothetical protein